jgi:hypothetical protein
MFRNILLPFISLISGLAGLYIDPKTDKGKTWIVIAILCASAITTGIYGYKDNRDAGEAAAQLEAANQKADRQIELAQTAKETSSVQLGLATSSQQELDLIVAGLRERGILAATTGQVSKNQVQQSLFADSARNRELQTLALNPSAQHSTIEYFSKDVDKEVVAKALLEGGLKFSQATARITDDPTNSIWAGDKVPLADVKFVALTLLRAGVQLHSVRRFQDGSGSKEYLIEIGADRKMDDASTLTVQQIEDLNEPLPRDISKASSGQGS